MKKNNTPAGFALGHATGDGNPGALAALVPRRQPRRREREGRHQLARDRQGARIRASRSTRPSSPAPRPGTTRRTTRRSWRATSTCTNNGISIYAAAKTREPEDRRRHGPRRTCRSARSASRRSSSSPSRSWPSTSPRRRTPARRSSPSCWRRRTTIPGWRRRRATCRTRWPTTTRTRSGRADPKNDGLRRGGPSGTLAAGGLAPVSEKHGRGARRLRGRRHVRQLLHRPRGREERDRERRAPGASASSAEHT